MKNQLMFFCIVLASTSYQSEREGDVLFTECEILPARYNGQCQDFYNGVSVIEKILYNNVVYGDRKF